MKLSLSLAALLLCATVVGCQPRVAGPTQTAQPTTSANEAGAPATTAANGLDATESDQQTDPGMTTAHDKTLSQERPSGDASSRAAPNDGDAEPPQ